MENQDEARDFFGYPQSKEEELHFEVPKREKELEEKLENLSDLIMKQMGRINCDYIKNKVFNSTKIPQSYKNYRYDKMCEGCETVLSKYEEITYLVTMQTVSTLLSKFFEKEESKE